MAISVLPTWPLLLFGVVEPAFLVWGYIVCLKDPGNYFAQQHPNPALLKTILSPQALSLSLQFGNVLLLLAFLALVCSFTLHPDVPKKYLLAVALADYGHIYAAYRGMGHDYFWDLSKWNDMAWGNIGISIFLNINRLLTLLGLFGRIGGRKDAAGKKSR